MRRFSLFLAVLFTTSTLAKTVSYDWDIGWVTAAPDGFTRPVQGINGQWPIPMIEANANDTIIVKIHNSLGNMSTSLHFHAQRHNGTGAMDGAIGVTQCDVYPGQSFTYEWTAWPPGTHWYHSHALGAYPDGLRGKMIIHDRIWEASLNVDEQIPLCMSDWYHVQTPTLISRYMHVDNTDGSLPIPDSFLFNETNKPTQFHFEPRKRYMLRIVNMSALTCSVFHIKNHTLTVVGVDGQHTHPKVAQTISLCAGQRYDVIVVGNSSPSGVQYIAEMTTEMLTSPPPPNATYSVVGGMTFRNDTQSASNTPPGILDDFTLKPLDHLPLLANVTKRINWRTNQTYYEGLGTRISIGAQPFFKPKVPTLLTALSTGDHAWNASTYGVGQAPEIVRFNDVVEIYMENPQPFPHPMHLHGHDVQLAGRGSGVWDGDESLLSPMPVRRDTVVVPADGYIVLRYLARNPGTWLFHCHIDFHLVGGMAAIIIEAPDMLQKTQSTSAQNDLTCQTSDGCALGNCACRSGGLTTQQSLDHCNTMFNTKNPYFGSMLTQ